MILSDLPTYIIAGIILFIIGYYFGYIYGVHDA